MEGFIEQDEFAIYLLWKDQKMHTAVQAASLLLPILGALLALRASMINVRDNIDAFIGDIARLPL